MDGIHAGTGSIMCSYNRVNNTYACENSKTMNGILKGELDFQGFVVSDWGGQHAGVDSANAGLDVTMPDSGFWGTELVTMVQNGSVSEDRVTDMATRYIIQGCFMLDKADEIQNYQRVVPNGTRWPHATPGRSWCPESWHSASDSRRKVSGFCASATSWRYCRARFGQEYQ